MRPWDAVFLDRDGTLNVSPPPGAYVLQPDQLRLLPGVGVAVAALNAAEVEVHVVTNQRCVALGLLDDAGLDSIHRRLVELLAADGATVDSIQVCPHDLDSCSCRKPSDGLLRRVLATRDQLDATRCAIIGDSWSDVRAGDALEIFRILLRPGGGAAGIADLVVPDLPTAVHHLLAASTPAGNPGSNQNMR